MDLRAIYAMAIPCQAASPVSDQDQVEADAEVAFGPPPESGERAAAHSDAAFGPPQEAREPAAADPEAAAGPPPEGAGADYEAASGLPSGRAPAPPCQSKRNRQVRKAYRNKWFRRLSVQAKIYNASGLARARGHLLPEPPRSAVPKPWTKRQLPRSLQAHPNIKGRGAWKQSTPEHICSTGFAPGETSLRTLCRSTGGAPSHARGCSLVLSSIIMEKQSASMREREHQSKRCRFDSTSRTTCSTRRSSSSGHRT